MTDVPPNQFPADSTNAHIWSTFGLCLMFWVLPIEADILFGLSYQFGFIYLFLAHFAVSALILAPLVLALRDGVSARRLLSSLRVLFVLLIAVIWAVLMTASRSSEV